MSCNNTRDEFEAWWIEHGYNLTQGKEASVDFAEVVWNAAVKQTEQQEEDV